MENQEYIADTLTLPWKYTHVCAAEISQSSKAYTYCGCVMIASRIGGYKQYAFYAPNGRRFRQEQKLINYMDAKNGIIRSSK